MSEENRTQAQQQSETVFGCLGCFGLVCLAIAGLEIAGIFTGFYSNGANPSNPAWLNPPSGPWIFGSIGVVFLIITVMVGSKQSGAESTTAQPTSAAAKSTSTDKKALKEDFARAIAEASQIADEKAKEEEAQRKAEQAALAEAKRLAREQAQQAEERRKAQQERLEATLAREQAAQAEAERLAHEQAKREQLSHEKGSPLMRDAPRQSLRKLVVEYGRSIGDDPMRCRSLLLDVCGEYRKEINILMAILEEQVVSDLLSSSAGVPREILLARLITRVCENRGLTEEVARWGVQTWVFALGL